MTTATQSKMPTIDLSDVEILRWLAEKLGQVQRARRQPKKRGRLHRV